MDAGPADRLQPRARTAIGRGSQDELVSDIDRALDGAGRDPTVAGRLHLARAIARQAGPDLHDAATDAVRAVVLLRQAARTAPQAHAAAVAALLWRRAGEIDRTVDLAVQSLIALADSEPTDHDALDACHALAEVFAGLSSFGPAMELAERAFSNSVALPIDVRGRYAFDLGHCAIESCLAAVTENGSDRDGIDQKVLDLALGVATYLESDTGSELSRLSAGGFRGEVALLRDDRRAYDAIGSLVDYRQAGDPAVDGLAGRQLLPWLRLVRGSAALRWGDPTVALALLDTAAAELQQLGDEHRLVRAVERRAWARMTLGDHRGAATDALGLVAEVRSHRIGEGDRLTNHILRRADVEGATDRLAVEAARLAPPAAVDAVTGIGTRRWLELRLDRIVRDSKLLAIVMLDVDQLQQINESFGNEIGDQVLARIGAILSEQVRSTDVLARYGGEEFVVILEDGGSDEARDLAERIRARLAEEPWGRLASGLAVTASAGAIEGPAWSARDLIGVVHRAIGRARGEGQDRITVAGLDPTA